ncbi:serine/threonine-protein phosphatase 6 regulatory ankyrin repeat subunit A-like isoform X1 [Neocloeon triangulifer]|uniref:serine/threonine-protein phosphatase 6 regulatory ankyrin repeat subunit A-like isoform X1 n=1 Tax=Neocloeon triangulifer TaxID=2078957 RepID=UPI00286F843B|nr:serine/threonine-protein phosphatase 6 regulatory ankyrin repeat subunit A-like isoform X1 [Neocloeon triangulifer]
MPFDIFKYEFRQVRKFLELKINETENPDQIENVKISITETIKKSQLIDVIVKENLLRLFSLLDDEITFEDSGRKGKFHFAKSDADEILINAWENSEDIAVRFLELGAYKNLTDCSSTAITRMFATVIKNNFANLFEKLNEQFYHTQFPFADPKLPHIGLSLSEFLFSKYTNEALYEALEFAAGENHHKILKYMIKKGVIDLSEEAASNTIQKAVDHNSVECVDLFVDYGFITSSLRLSGEKFNLDLSTAKALLKTTSALAAELAPRIFEFALGKCDFALAKYILEVDKTIAEATHFEDGMNALQVAASEKWSMNRTNASEMCRWLVNDLNFEIGFKDNKGWNALHHAADSINLYTVKFLVGKDPGIITSVTDKGENAAHLAANAGLGGGKVIKYLHSRDNQMIKQKTKKNRTVLHFAAAAKNELELYEWLIEKWVDLDAVDDEGLNVTHFAVNQFVGSLDLLIFLYNKNNELIKQKTNNDTTLLHFAAAREDNATKIISWLTDKGLDAADVDNRGWNALHFAASRGETRNLLFFLNGRPELVTALTKDGENVMHLLQNRVFGEFELQDLDYLIKKAHGLNKNLINQKTKSNKTVLHRVAETGFVKTFKRLVGLRLEVHAVDDQGWNVVHFAASGINVKVLEYIHENWPELKNTVTKDGENAMHLMSSNEKVNAKILKSFNGLGGELINQRTKTNKTVLHYAAQGGNDGVCRWLVEKMGLEVDAEDDNGWNAMHFASLTNDSFVTALFVYLHRICPGLIERRTKRNETTLHIAVKQRCVPKVTWLLHKGVDPATKDVDGKTALDLAHPEDVRALNRICGARAGQGDEEEPQLVSSSGEICTQSKDFLSPAD